jgi:transcriptional regulator with XRE-family HTH domain
VAKRKPIETMPIAERLRRQRVEVLGKSVRDLAKLLDISPIHMSDIETGKRAPSEELLLKVAAVYGIPEAELRAGFARPDPDVIRVATESTVAAEKSAEFLRRASGLSAKKWDKVIAQVGKLKDEKEP